MATDAAAKPAPSSGGQPEFFLVVNPQSGGGSTGRQWPKLEAQAQAVLGRFESARTTRVMEAAEITRRALEQGYRNIIAVGGDGTLNEVVNGFFDEQSRPIAPGAAVGLLPRGTGGDFRKTTKIPAGWEAAAKVIRDSKPKTVDVGRVRFKSHEGKEVTRFFLNVASCGIPGAVDDRVNRSSKMLGGKASFMLASFMALLGFRDQKVRFRIDDQPPEEMPITALALGNAQYFGGGMWVAPHAQLDDGLLGGTLWSGYGLSDFIFRQKGIYSGEHVKWSRTRTFTAKRVEIDSDERVLLDIDGEQPGILPAVFDLVPSSIGLRSGLS